MHLSTLKIQTWRIFKLNDFIWTGHYPEVGLSSNFTLKFFIEILHP